MSRIQIHSRLLACAVSIGVFICADSLLADPRIDSVSIRGLQIGVANDLTIRGSSFDDSSRIHAPMRFQQTITANSSDSVTIRVNVDEQTVPGIYPFRMVTDDGMSNPILMAVDHAPQTAFAPLAKQIPTAMTGSLVGQEIRRVEFDLEANQLVSVGVEGRRLGSQLRPVLRAYDSEGRQVAWANPMRILHGDCRLQLLASKAGKYRVELHDQLYKGPKPGYFRLVISDRTPQRHAYPIGEQDNSQTVSHWSGRKWDSNALPVLFRSKYPELTEESFANASVPFGVSGRIAKKGETDVYEFSVRSESTIRCGVWSNRLGTPLDSRLRIMTLEGKQLAAGDDHDRSLDPMVDVNIPKGVTTVRAELSAQAGTSSEAAVYRLSVENKPSNEVNVSTETNQIVIAAGSQAVVPFRIERQGSKLPVFVSAGGASLLDCKINPIGETDERGLMEIVAPANTKAVLPMRFVVSTGPITGSNQSKRFVTVPSINGNVSFPASVDFVAAIVPKSPIAVKWQSAPIATTFRGGRFAGSVLVKNSTKRKVSLKLMTTQKMPGEKQRAAQQIRLENVKMESDRFDFEIYVPGGIPLDKTRDWSFAIRADLKSDDGKRVTHSAYTRLRNSTATKALQLAIASPAELKALAGQEDPVEFVGKISRLPETDQPVTVQLLGLPEDSGVKVAAATVDATTGQFKLSIDLSSVTKELNLDKLNLQAKFDSEVVLVRDVRSDNVAVKLRVKPPASTAAE